MLELNLEYEEIYPRIFIYKNLLPNIGEIYDIVSESEYVNPGKAFFNEWSQWFVFGTYGVVKDTPSAIRNFHTLILDDDTSPLEKEKIKEQMIFQMRAYTELSDANKLALMHYTQKNNVNLPDGSYIPEINIAKYYSGVDFGPNREDTLAMQFHTDYTLGEWYWPNDNFLVTCTTYINDDYDGGEIFFACGKDILKYKPEAGDVLVFPSGSPFYPESPERQPYFHAVNSIKVRPKYFTRNYIKYPHAAEDLWNRNHEKYGEDWPAMAKARAEGHNLLIVKDKNQRPFDPDTYHNEKSFKFYGSNLISKFYDIPEGFYEVYSRIYEFEEFQ